MSQSENRINISLSKDEALVLFEFFARFEEPPYEFSLIDNAEFIAVSSISAQLDKILIEPFKPEFQSLLQQAKSRLAEGYEGLAPGVKPLKNQ